MGLCVGVVFAFYGTNAYIREPLPAGDGYYPAVCHNVSDDGG